METLRIPTGITGFDELIAGGIPVGSLVLLSGNAGSGKTLFTSHCINSNSINGKSLYCGFFENRENMIKISSNFGFDFLHLETEGKLKILEFYPVLEVGITAIVSEIESTIEKFQPSLLVIDSISSLAGDLKNEQEMRVLLKMIDSISKAYGITVILISELSLNSNKHGFGIEEFVADGLIIMRYVEINNSIKRCFAILKMRETNHNMNIWEFEIGDNGIEVKERLERTTQKVMITSENIFSE